MSTVHAADFGPLVIETDIDAAVIATLDRWLPTYLFRARQERDLPVFAAPRFTNVLENEEFPSELLPAVIVTTAATDGDPQHDGNGTYYAGWRVVVSCVVASRTPPEVRELAAVFGGACRRLLIHHPALGGLATGVKWTGGNVAPVGDVSEAGRYLAAGINQFTVYVDDVIGGQGPLEPGEDSPYAPSDPGSPDTPYGPLVEVDRVTVDVRGRPPTNPQLGS